MKTLIRGGRVIDPESGTDQTKDLWIDGDRIVEPATLDSNSADRLIDASGCVVMAGGIDIHTHISGGKLSLARLLMQDSLEQEAFELGRQAMDCDYLPAAAITGQRYLEMGYTVAFEPAVIPCNARAAHAEMADIPGLATGGFCLLGNDELLLRLIAANSPQALINDYVAWMVRATQSIAVKVVNAGGISAFKFGERNLDVNELHPHYGITPGDVIRVLARACHEIGLVHPLHIHCSNLGVPGNIDSTLATIMAADGFPVHLTHAQFHCYGKGEHGMTSAAEKLVAALHLHRNVTIDVGQIMFGQTVTISADAPHQFDNRGHASPRKSVIADIECEAGCGVVPFRYRKKQFVHALQWAIGLELFLKINDPSRVFLTTDHPNGAPFTAYPHLIRLLCDRTFRETALAEIDQDAAASSSLAGIDREYSLTEIATMTRSAPAAILGLSDRGHLAAGAIADVVVYKSDENAETMFRSPQHVFAGGKHIVDRENNPGGIDLEIARTMDHQTLIADVSYDPASVDRFRSMYNEHSTFDFSRLAISDDELHSTINSRPVRQTTRGRTS
ncbi:formylmethanofuran dehydrogenase subunit A [Rhodopirellula sp. MGV]|uniref:formylmethanofuran dehydrogenase subunit A n=1 Tax=Rhodopirellula sp. MGV TaxID=2023130 RepID=UPI000B96E88A|nr:formylmethanofuran dehydrogenase subunit A [Rhodopirellula sp. MGV]OYP28515.1 formylmethanofuran dehydrogenase subunit A [Rhodopirellula sp. MGV]PNY38908.1 formylmethanofuran dehydrogenase subunit A [Rhodopirellula baltica]